MPTTDQKGDSKPGQVWPGQEFSCCSAGGTLALAGAASANSVIFSVEAAPSRRPCAGRGG